MDSSSLESSDLRGYKLINPAVANGPISDLRFKHFGNNEDSSQLKCKKRASVKPVGVHEYTVKLKEHSPRRRFAESTLAIKSGVLGISSNTFDRRVDEIFQNYQMRQSNCPDNGSDDESDGPQDPLGQPLKLSKAIMDFKSSPHDKPIQIKSTPLNREFSPVVEHRLSSIEKGNQVPILASSTSLKQPEQSEDGKLNKTMKCHKRHCIKTTCPCIRLNPSHPRRRSAPNCLLKKLTEMCNSVKLLRERMTERTKERELMIQELLKLE